MTGRGQGKYVPPRDKFDKEGENLPDNAFNESGQESQSQINALTPLDLQELGGSLRATFQIQVRDIMQDNREFFTESIKELKQANQETSFEISRSLDEISKAFRQFSVTLSPTDNSANTARVISPQQGVARSAEKQPVHSIPTLTSVQFQASASNTPMTGGPKWNLWIYDSQEQQANRDMGKSRRLDRKSTRLNSSH